MKMSLTLVALFALVALPGFAPAEVCFQWSDYSQATADGLRIYKNTGDPAGLVLDNIPKTDTTACIPDVTECGNYFARGFSNTPALESGNSAIVLVCPEGIDPGAPVMPGIPGTFTFTITGTGEITQ